MNKETPYNYNDWLSNLQEAPTSPHITQDLVAYSESLPTVPDPRSEGPYWGYGDTPPSSILQNDPVSEAQGFLPLPVRFDPVIDPLDQAARDNFRAAFNRGVELQKSLQNNNRESAERGALARKAMELFQQDRNEPKAARRVSPNAPRSSTTERADPGDSRYHRPAPLSPNRQFIPNPLNEGYVPIQLPPLKDPYHLSNAMFNERLQQGQFDNSRRLQTTEYRHRTPEQDIQESPARMFGRVVIEAAGQIWSSTSERVKEKHRLIMAMASHALFRCGVTVDPEISQACANYIEEVSAIGEYYK